MDSTEIVLASILLAGLVIGLLTEYAPKIIQWCDSQDKIYFSKKTKH